MEDEFYHLQEEARRHEARLRARKLLTLLVPGWPPTTTQILWVIRIAIVLGLLLVGLILISQELSIPLLDLSQLLFTASIPVVIAIVGNRYTQQRAQDEALQTYLDRISEMVTADQPLHRARPGDNLSALARSRTLTVLARLDGVRKGSVLQFLHESGLITKTSDA